MTKSEINPSDTLHRDMSNSGVHKSDVTTSIDYKIDGLSSNDGTQPEHESRGWFHWHEPGTSKEEKRLIFKLDWFLLSFSCLCFFIKQLDQNNISNAYVSGMKEELGCGPGNELSWMNTYFNVGLIIGGPFSNVISPSCGRVSTCRPACWSGPSVCCACIAATRRRSSKACASASACLNRRLGQASSTCSAAGTGDPSSRAAVRSSSRRASWAKCSPATSRPPSTAVCRARGACLRGDGSSSLTLSWPFRSRCPPFLLP